MSFFTQYPKTVKGIAIALPAVILYYSTLSGTIRQILTPKRYDEHPRHFCRGVHLKDYQCHISDVYKAQQQGNQIISRVQAN